MNYTLMYLLFLWTVANATNIQLLKCDPPDVPEFGGYGPKLSEYWPGDMIHYFCQIDTFIGGNYFRKCEDTGTWSGNTPVCDAPSIIPSTTQSSTANSQSGSELASDGFKTTCTSTIGGEKGVWSGNFSEPGELIRVMLFLPKGQVSFEVVLVKENGEELICGTQTRNVDHYDWTFQNCPGPNNNGATGLQIRSLINDPLRICEIQAYVLTSPKCVDPHVRIDSGHLVLNRHKALLVCDETFTKSRNFRLECIREGVWNSKNLYCLEDPWDSDREHVSNDGRGPNDVPRGDNPDRERERIRGTSQSP